MAKTFDTFQKIQGIIDNDFRVSVSNKKIKKTSIPNVEATYEEYEGELRRLINYTKGDLFLDENHHSLFVFGDTGVGKTVITANIAKEEGCVYHKLEVQKIPIEILQGFPYLSNVERKDGEMMVAKLAPSTILPPSDDDRTWILHLDEFNKADPEKMAAIMNLVTTGELGGSADYDDKNGKSKKYRLPRKTIIVGSGNTKSQQNVENMNIVNSMDIATSERWHRTMYLPYNAESWLNSFACKEFTFKDSYVGSRVPGIIVNFILDKYLEEESKQAPFIIPIISGSKEGVETERTTSPRAWTFVGDRMFIDMYYDYQSMSNKEKKPYEEKAKITSDIIKRTLDGFYIFAREPENQVQYFANQVYEFGLSGSALVANVISRYIFFAENRVMPEDVIFDYASHRTKIKNNLSTKKGLILYLLLSMGYYLSSLKEAIESTMEKKCAINISTFITDNNIPAEDVVAFIQTVVEKPSEASVRINDILIDICEKYQVAYNGYYYTSEKELKKSK